MVQALHNRGRGGGDHVTENIFYACIGTRHTWIVVNIFVITKLLTSKKNTALLKGASLQAIKESSVKCMFSYRISRTGV